MSKLSVLGGDPERFPPSYLALNDPNGLLAIGGDLRAERLIRAYKKGIFPWYDEDQPILWWTPDPRMVLFPKEVHCSKSMLKFMRKTNLTVRIDGDFDAVVRQCAGKRPYSDGTWINPQMQLAYSHLHEMGYAHSIEVLDGEQIVGGLYGIGLGRIFYGESMFSHSTNASKLAFISLARWLENEKFALIDCQVSNPHLESLGARNIQRSEFEQLLRINTTDALVHSCHTLWQDAKLKTISRDGHIHP